MKRMRAFLGIPASLLVVLLLIVPAESASRDSCSKLSSQEFAIKFNKDIKLLRSMVDNIERTLDTVEGDNILFASDRKKDFDIGEKEKLYTIWAGYLDYMLAFEGLTGYYGDFYLLKKRTNHANAFLLAYAAYVAKFSNGLRFIHKTMNNDLYEKKLDDSSPDYGIPAGMYARLKWNTIHVQDVSNIMAGYQYYKFVLDNYRKQGLMTAETSAWVFSYIDSQYEYVKKELAVKGAQFFLANGLDIVKEKTFSAWFPIQMSASEWMGDTKVKRLKGSLIAAKQISDMKRDLRLGDIIVERRNWYLSNIGLPGFWPHAELYVGTPDDMRRYFVDDSVTKHYRKKGNYKNFIDYLDKKYPAKMKEYLKYAPDGYPHEVIKAVSEGVKFSSLQEAASADYIGVMRPRLSKLDIAKAIDEAFNYLGRPYDFNFDFLTDSSIVCSELIYKIYQKGPDKKGLDLKLRDIAGRKAMPPNDIVEKFDRESDASQRELDFVYFLDGSEKDKKAVVKGPEEFRLSYKRPKWDIAQE